MSGMQDAFYDSLFMRDSIDDMVVYMRDNDTEAMRKMLLKTDTIRLVYVMYVNQDAEVFKEITDEALMSSYEYCTIKEALDEMARERMCQIAAEQQRHRMATMMNNTSYSISGYTCASTKLSGSGSGYYRHYSRSVQYRKGGW